MAREACKLANPSSSPQEDTSVLLDVTAKTLQSEAGKRKLLLIFDSVSDLLVSIGFEKSYGFLKAEKEMLAKEPNATALFVVKRNAQDERVGSMIKSLYAHHLSYDGGGFSVTRET